MINYGYFRHRFDAHTDPKLNELADEMGIIIYGYYYTLIELYGAKYADIEEGEKVQIHIRTIANTWRKRVDSCDKVLTKLQLSGMLVYTKCKNTYTIDIPNFPKYYGSYKKTDRSSVANKRKEKKRKENIKQTQKIEPEKSKFNLEEIYNAYPKKQGKKKGLDGLSWIKHQEQFDLILNAAKNYSDFVKANGTDQKYIKMFSTWVNQESYSDTYEIPKTKEQIENELNEKWLDYFSKES